LKDVWVGCLDGGIVVQLNPRSITVAFTGLVLVFSMPIAAQPRRTGAAQPPPQSLTGIDAMRALYQSGKPADIERFALTMLWKDIRQPEVLFYLGTGEERLRKTPDAAAFYTLFLRTLDEASKAGGGAAPYPDSAKHKQLAERKLKALKQDPAALAAAYAKTATGKKFTTPEAVDDVWMNNVRGDLFSLNGLYAWKLVGGRKDAKPDWIHNTQGAMHVSGLKKVDDVEGRKGVLFTIPLKDMNSADADSANRDELQKLGHNSHVEATNVGGGKVLRAGLRGYGFPVLVKVKLGDKELHSETVPVDKWSDLKVALPPESKGKPVSVELIVPEGQKSSEGVWIDYLDFFEN
jgi:hypothetical protein